MRRAVDVRHARVEPGLQLARVEVAPLAVAVVVDRASTLALGALRRGALGPRQPHVHRAAATSRSTRSTDHGAVTPKIVAYSSRSRIVPTSSAIAAAGR